MHPRLFFLSTGVLLSAFFCGSVISADAPKPTTAEELAALKKENATLREENQRLRKMLAQPTQPIPVAPAPPSPPATPAPPPPAADGKKAEVLFWMSSTGKRHNPRCRYFQTSKGQPCAANEGIACKICGG